MTDSRCWIDLSDDEALINRLRSSSDVKIDPSRIDLDYRYLWINELSGWAKRKGLPIEFPDMGWIVNQITVNREQLLEFLADMLGPEKTESDRTSLNKLRSLIRDYGNQNCSYRILADEY